MKTIHGWLKAILCSGMIVLLASCASTIPTDSTVGDMSVEQARKVLATELMNNNPHIGLFSANSNLIRGNGITDVRVTLRRLLVTDKKGKQSTFIFSKLPQISSIFGNVVGLAGEQTFTNNEATSIANALYVLKQNAIKEDNEFDASFAASLPDYRNKAASNTALPEEANKYKVQAEGAVRDKQFDDAADFYAEALKIAPWWPVGHFNRAVVLGETGDYEMAIRDMKHYLQLVPDAANARAAQDKIYDWERLESK